MPRRATRSTRKPRAQQTQESVTEALPKLLEAKEVSLRALAAAAGVNQSHLSRALREGSGRVISGELAERLAKALGLAADYFPETRAWRAHQAIDADPKLRERIYRAIR